MMMMIVITIIIIIIMVFALVSTYMLVPLLLTLRI
jgi:hypothetical protein